jgi:hypothetical protein
VRHKEIKIKVETTPIVKKRLKSPDHLMRMNPMSPEIGNKRQSRITIFSCLGAS